MVEISLYRPSSKIRAVLSCEVVLLPGVVEFAAIFFVDNMGCLKT